MLIVAVWVFAVAGVLRWTGTWMGIGSVVRDSVRHVAAALEWFGVRWPP